MAIITEHFDLGGRTFNRVYSDAGRYVVRDGVAYSEACDPADFGRTYTEGDLMEDADGLTADEIIAAIEEALA